MDDILDLNKITIKPIEIKYKVPIIDYTNDSYNKMNDLLYNLSFDSNNIKITEKNVHYKSKNLNNIIKNLTDNNLNKFNINNYNLCNNYKNFINNNNYSDSIYNCCLNEENYNYSLQKWLIPVVKEKKNIYINNNYFSDKSFFIKNKNKLSEIFGINISKKKNNDSTKPYEEDFENIFTLPSYGYLNQMLKYFVNGKRIDKMPPDYKKKTDQESLPQHYNNYYIDILRILNKDISDIKLFINDILEVENNYIIKYSFEELKTSMDIFNIANIDIDINLEKIDINNFKEIYKKKFIDQHKINILLNKELIILERFWDGTYSQGENLFVKFQTKYNLNTFSFKKNKIMIDEKFKFIHNNELIYKSKKKDEDNNIKHNKIREYILKDFYINDDSGIKDVSVLKHSKKPDLKTSFKYEDIDEAQDTKKNLMINRITNILINNINENNTFLNLFDEIEYENKYYDNYTRFFEKIYTNKQADAEQSILMNYIKEDYYSKQNIFWDNISILSTNKEMFLHTPWLSNYTPIQNYENNLINNNTNTQVVRKISKSSNIYNIEFSGDSPGIDNRTVEQISSKNSFETDDYQEVRISTKNDKLHIIGFYYKDPINSKTIIHSLGDKNTFLNKLIRIENKNMFLGYSNLKSDELEAKTNFIELNEDSFEYKTDNKNNFQAIFRIDNILKIFTNYYDLNDPYLININSINNYLKYYDYNVNYIPSCFINKINYFLDLSILKYRLNTTNIIQNNKIFIIENYKIIKKKIKEKKIKAATKIQSLIRGKLTRKKQTVVTVDQLDEFKIEDSNTDNISSNDTYLLIEPDVIEQFLENDDLDNEFLLKKICFFFNGDNLTNLIGKDLFNFKSEIYDFGEDINNTIKVIITQIYKNKFKDTLELLSEDDEELYEKALTIKKHLLFELLFDFEYNIGEDELKKKGYQQPFFTLISNYYDPNDNNIKKNDEYSYKYTYLTKDLETTDSVTGERVAVPTSFKKMIKILVKKGIKNKKNELIEDYEKYDKLKTQLQYYNENNKINEALKLQYIITKLTQIEDNYETTDSEINYVIYPMLYNINTIPIDIVYKQDEDDYSENKSETQIRQIKQKIELEVNEDKLDCYKYFINPYNLIDNIAIRNKNASRAYPKLWEVFSPTEKNIESDHLYKLLKKPDLNIVFIAEAPGGFIYCLDDIRTQVLGQKQSMLEEDSKVTFDIITLIENRFFKNDYDEFKNELDRKKSIDTIFQKQFLQTFYHKIIFNKKGGNIGKINKTDIEHKLSKYISKDLYNYIKNENNVDFGEASHDSGNILETEIIEKIYQYYNVEGNKKADIITADGGFDIIGDDEKNLKLYDEYISAPLHFGQIITALLIQEIGGVFILKIKGMYSNLTTNLLYILSKYYERIEIIKPYISKVFNNEKYIKCYKFKGIVLNQDLVNDAAMNVFKEEMFEILKTLKRSMPNDGSFDQNTIKIPSFIDKSKKDYISFKIQIDNINNTISLRQYHYYKHIEHLITLIEQKENNTLIEIFNEYCKNMNYTDIYKLLNNVILGKYIMYPLKMSLTLCYNINLKTKFKIKNNTENLLYILNRVNNKEEYKLINPYFDEINKINSIDQKRKRNEMRNNFIEKHCANYTNNNYIKYNLYNEIQNLRQIINPVLNPDSQPEPEQPEQPEQPEPVSQPKINYLLNKEANNDFWDIWLLNETNNEKYNEINRNITNNIKEIISESINEKNFRKKYGINDDKIEQLNNIINNIIKFYGWNLDKINFTKCFCRHYDILDEEEYNNGNNGCLFCDEKINLKDNIIPEFRLNIISEIESPLNLLSNIIFSHFDSKIGYKKNFSINELNELMVELNFNEYIDITKISKKQVETIKEMIIIFYHLTKEFEYEIKNNKKTVLIFLYEEIKEILENKNTSLKELEESQSNRIPSIYDNLNKIKIEKENIQEYLKSIEEIYKNDSVMQRNFMMYLSKLAAIGDNEDLVQIFRNPEEYLIKKYETQNIFNNIFSQKIKGGAGDSEKPEQCIICKNEANHVPKKTEIKVFDKVWDDIDWDTYNIYLFESEVENLGVVEAYEEYNNYKMHKFCKMLIEDMEVDELKSKLPVKAQEDVEVDSNFYKFINTDFMVKDWHNEKNKIIPMNSQIFTIPNIDRYILEGDINNKIYYGLIKIALFGINLYYQNLIFTTILEEIYKQSDKNYSIYITKIKLIKYCIILLENVININNEIYNSKKINIIRKIINILINNEISELKNSRIFLNKLLDKINSDENNEMYKIIQSLTTTSILFKPEGDIIVKMLSDDIDKKLIIDNSLGHEEADNANEIRNNFFIEYIKTISTQQFNDASQYYIIEIDNEIIDNNISSSISNKIGAKFQINVECKDFDKYKFKNSLDNNNIPILKQINYKLFNKKNNNWFNIKLNEDNNKYYKINLFNLFSSLEDEYKINKINNPINIGIEKNRYFNESIEVETHFNNTKFAEILQSISGLYYNEIILFIKKFKYNIKYICNLPLAGDDDTKYYNTYIKNRLINSNVNYIKFLNDKNDIEIHEYVKYKNLYLIIYNTIILFEKEHEKTYIEPTIYIKLLLNKIGETISFDVEPENVFENKFYYLFTYSQGTNVILKDKLDVVANEKKENINKDLNDEEKQEVEEVYKDKFRKIIRRSGFSDVIIEPIIPLNYSDDFLKQLIEIMYVILNEIVIDIGGEDSSTVVEEEEKELSHLQSSLVGDI